MAAEMESYLIMYREGRFRKKQLKGDNIFDCESWVVLQTE